jgi:hypothetical protein
MTDFEQFLVTDSGFTRRAAVSAQAKADALGMGSVEDDISAMFDSSSHSSVSLAGVMEPVLTSSELFASFASHHHQGLSGGGGGLAQASSMSQAALSQHPPSQTSSFSAAYDTFMPTFAPAPPTSGGGGGLHRYHSAPSAFLQSLAEDFTMGNSSPPLFPESAGLAPITELDVERSGSGNSITEFEQFLSPDSDFSRRAALSAQTKPENSEMFANLFPSGKNTALLRQKSLPVPPSLTIVPKPDPMDSEQHSEESISGTSDDNTLVNGIKASMLDDFFSAWPVSPGSSGGKRARGSAAEGEISSGLAENPKSFRLNNQNGLIRHASLPTPAVAASAAMIPTTITASDDHYVQMRARAKRGCATHPRSIAERVRRTRISERMKKLQDLVPNMEKTTNTSDMLDETVEYVKSLQLKVSELNATIAQLKAATMTPTTT